MVARGRQALRAPGRGQGGIEPVVMLRDNGVAAEAIAREVGIDKAHAELLPEDKVIVMDSPITKYGSVAMFGDGVNDAPVAARASMGHRQGRSRLGRRHQNGDRALIDDLGKTQPDTKPAERSPSNPAARPYPTTGKMLVETARPKNRLLAIGIVILVFAVFGSAILVGYLDHLNGTSRHGLLAHSPGVPDGAARHVRGKAI